MSKKLYVAYKKDGKPCSHVAVVFRSERTPTSETHGDKYKCVIGPFMTRRGAEFMRDHGYLNPHCQTVADAERLANLTQ